MLKLEEVRKNYHKDRGLISANLTIENNKLYLFVGENGSGKSTTIKLISKVIFNTFHDGTIKNDFKKIIYLPDKRSYPKLLNVRTYLRYYLLNDKKIDKYIEKYHLPNKKIGGLSKGMLQKVGIIQTILCDGDLYLFDEPTDGLDNDSVKIFKEDILKLLNDNKTIIISTHNKKIYNDLSPCIYYFKDGICK